MRLSSNFMTLPPFLDSNASSGLHTGKATDCRYDRGVRSLRRDKEVNAAMSNHTGTIWSSQGWSNAQVHP